MRLLELVLVLAKHCWPVLRLARIYYCQQYYVHAHWSRFTLWDLNVIIHQHHFSSLLTRWKNISLRRVPISQVSSWSAYTVPLRGRRLPWGQLQRQSSSFGTNKAIGHIFAKVTSHISWLIATLTRACITALSMAALTGEQQAAYNIATKTADVPVTSAALIATARLLGSYAKAVRRHLCPWYAPLSCFPCMLLWAMSGAEYSSWLRDLTHVAHFQVNEEYLKCKFANNGDPFKCADKGKAVTERSKQLWVSQVPDTVL